MKILVIGAGGREHALAWKLAGSSQVQKVFVAPGNAGTQSSKIIENIALTSISDLIDFTKRESIALTVVGPEEPLAQGIVDKFLQYGLKIFGPTRCAAQLESSKAYAKSFMLRHRIPTAAAQTFIDPRLAHAYIDQVGAPIVIKADGLAAGKGVVVASSLKQAHESIDLMLNKDAPAGAQVLVEEYLEGEEASFIVMCDGQHVLPLASSQDHKRLLNADQGPNTGGMGAYSPAPVITEQMHHRIMQEVIWPTIEGMALEGTPYTGFLYAGLMIAPGTNPQRKLSVLEFNCRMGDPETQPIMMRIKSDLVEVLQHGVQGTLNQAHITWDPQYALGVVLATHGYPSTPRTGDIITGLTEKNHDCMIFHAGTVLKNNQIQTSGGRVLCVTALGKSILAAQERAYAGVQGIHFDGFQFRNDIGWRAIK